MIRISLLLLALVSSMFIPIVALAQTPAEQAVAFCEARYSDKLRQVLCIQDQNAKILAAEQARVREELAALKADKAPAPVSAASSPQQQAAPDAARVASARAANEKRAAEIVAEKAKPAPPRSAPARPAPPSAPAFVGGVPYRIVPTPGQFAATTFDVDGPRMRVQRLSAGVEAHVPGADQVRVVVRRNGVTVPIGHADGVFDTVYADLDRNGRPDRMVYAAVDPLAIDELFISQVGPRDRIEVIYLVPIGKIVEVPGLPPQILWGIAIRVEHDRVKYPGGRYYTDATSGWEL